MTKTKQQPTMTTAYVGDCNFQQPIMNDVSAWYLGW